MKNLKSGVDWSGIRTVEAEILVAALRHIAEMLDHRASEE
jgi:hypothetical protein